MYFLKRILLFIPTLFVVSLAAFYLGKITPNDPVDLYTAGELDNTPASDFRYADVAKKLGLDQPNFYFSVTSAAFPDTLHRILRQNRRKAACNLTAQTGDWAIVERYLHAEKDFEIFLWSEQKTVNKETLNSLRKSLSQLFILYKKDEITAEIKSISQIIELDTLSQNNIISYFNNLQKTSLQLWTSPRPTSYWLPKFHWHGLDNQYHHLISNFVTGNFGVSYEDSRPIADKIMDYGRWTLLLNLLAILIAYGLAVPLGVWSAAHHGSSLERKIQYLLSAFYAMPAFWLATLLIVFFTNSDYGMNFFPPSGVGDFDRSKNFYLQIFEVFPHLILPLICLTYNNLAFITRQLKGSTLEALQQDFIRTARAKGMDSKIVLWRHALRNALFPLVTMLATLLPASLAGSLVIESIFNIPGLGSLLQKAVMVKDWNVVFTLTMLGAILTLTGILIADLLFSIIDPRVTFSKRKV